MQRNTPPLEQALLGHSMSSARLQSRLSPASSLKIAVLSTYPPRECGLATFASDLCESLLSAGVRSVGIVSMLRSAEVKAGVRESGQPLASTPFGGAIPRGGEPPASRLRPHHVISVLDQCDDSYKEAAERINYWADVVVVEHEFGIYGGEDGAKLLILLDRLRVPYIVTLHTVVPRFTANQCEVLREVCAKAAAVTVFTATARDLLADQKIVSEDQVVCIPHGAPSELYNVNRTAARAMLHVDGRVVLSSFGLLSEGKGLELAIEALAVVVAGGLNAEFIVAGKTHPDVFRRDGDRYRESLVSLARRLGVADRVRFIDGFLPIAGIAELLAATDVFLTPYINSGQIVSGALTFALAAGCPVVSTPYLYAQDQLAGGAGILVHERSADLFGQAILKLVTNPAQIAQAREVARSVGAQMKWTAIGERIAELCSYLLSEISDVDVPSFAAQLDASQLDAAQPETPTGRAAHSSDVGINAIGDSHALAVFPSDQLRRIDSKDPAPWYVPDRRAAPQLPTTHLARLVDSRGIIQHATGVVPLLSSGYCVDDVARLVPIARELSTTEPWWDATLARSVAFLAHAYEPGTSQFRNFMSWTGEWEDKPHFGDHVGRALMGLAAAVSTNGYDTLLVPLLGKVLANWPRASLLHPDCYALIAQAQEPAIANIPVARAMLDHLLRAYAANEESDWVWPETRVRYDQARFPQALLVGGVLLGDDRAISLGFRSLEWLTKHFDQGNHLRFPGHRGWSSHEPVQWTGDEQPLEAFAFLQAHMCAYRISGEVRHLRLAEKANAWFYGANRLAASLADLGQGSCFDGLGSVGVNRNCGAESTLALLASDLEMRLAWGPTTGASSDSGLNAGLSPVVADDVLSDLDHSPFGSETV